MYNIDKFINEVVKKANETSKLDVGKFWRAVGDNQQVLLALRLELNKIGVDETVVTRANVDKLIAEDITGVKLSDVTKVIEFVNKSFNKVLKGVTTVAPPTPPANKKIKVTFKGGEDALIDGQASKEVTVTGNSPTAPVGLKGLAWPTVTIKTEKAAAKQRDGLKWTATGGITGVKEQAEINNSSSATDVVLTVVTKAKS
jgi:hypothetical protein